MSFYRLQLTPNIKQKIWVVICKDEKIEISGETVNDMMMHQWLVSLIFFFPLNEVVQVEPWTILTHKKPKPEWIAYNPRSLRPPPLCRDRDKFMKLLSWNVNGLRSLVKSKSFSAIQLAQREDFDVLCLQETKIQARDDIPIVRLYFIMVLRFTIQQLNWWQWGHFGNVNIWQTKNCFISCVVVIGFFFSLL